MTKKITLLHKKKKTCSFFIMWQEKNSWKCSMHNADVSSYYIRGFQINDFVLQSGHNLRLWNAKFTRAKLIWDRSTVSSVEPKFDNLFFDNLHVLNRLQIIFVLVCRNGRTILVFTCTKHVNQQKNGLSNLGLIEEIMELYIIV